MRTGESDDPTLVGDVPTTEDTSAAPGRWTSSAADLRPAEDMQRGSTLGRYVVLDVLGRGGMGVVYAAYDPELDRKIAVKLVKCDPRGEALNTSGRSRLLREAQALAKLSHPNIVTVYDVGALGDSIFVAMEFVAGETLKSWAETRAPGSAGWREALGVMLPAGRALACAHRQGIVHRDFKLENVMIDAAGRVVVLDFGLARPAGSRSASSGDATPGVDMASLSSSLLLPLTITGSVMGTPAYMSPEQFAGRDTDAASDQFSFCVAVYEVLYGERPFAGETINELTCAVFEQRLRPPPRSTNVPGWLRRVLLRGLALAPDERWPSMEALLAQLQQDPAARRRKVILATAAGSVLIGSAWGASVLSSRDDPCGHLDDAMQDAWGSERREALALAFRSGPTPYAEDTLSRIVGELDAWSDAWLQARQQACEAAQRSGSVEATDASFRGACLDAALRRLDALVRVLASADEAMIEKALGAVQRLPKAESCEDARSWRQSVPVPDDPSKREPVEALRVDTADVLALMETGLLDRALALADELLERAHEIDYEPAVAEVAAIRGGVLLQLGRYAEALPALEEASALTREHGLDDLSVRCLRGLAFLHVALTKKHDLADWLLQDGEILNRRSGSSPIVRADLLIDRGRLERARDDNDAAIEALEQAVALLQEHGGPASTEVVALDNLATSYLRADRHEDAARVLEQAEEAARRGLGPTHPLRGNLVVHRGQVASARGLHDEAVELMIEAIRVFEGAYGEVHPNIGAVYNNMGLELERTDARAEAVGAYRQALSVFERAYGSDHPEIARVLTTLGNALRRSGQAEEAEPLHRRALAIRQGLSNEDDILDIQELLADDLRVLNRCDEAEQLYRAVIAARQQDETSELGYSVTGLGLCQAWQGQLDVGITTLERAVELMDVDGSERWRAYARLALAIALRHAGRRTERATTIAREARTILEPKRTVHAALWRDIERWLDGEPVIHPTI
jgi:eukaryotic-like serine/threonine-protein kinase